MHAQPRRCAHFPILACPALGRNVTLVGPYLPPLPGAPEGAAVKGRTQAMELDFDLNLDTVNVDVRTGTFRVLNLVRHARVVVCVCVGVHACMYGWVGGWGLACMRRRLSILC